MAKVKVNTRVLERQLRKAQQQAANKLLGANGILATEIKSSISKGISPVKDIGRFKKYSRSYQEAIKKGRYAQFGKRIRPVNLKLTGDLLKSFYAKAVGGEFGRYRIGFTDEKVEYHNTKGAGKSKTIRRLLPKTGETFTRSIVNRVRESVLTVLKNNIRR